MSEKRFTFLTGASGVLFYDNEVMMPYPVVVDLLNSQSDALLSYDKLVNDLKEENEQLRKYNGQLKERLEKINGGYGHLTHRNGLTANEWLIESQERELKKKNEQISAWIEQHSKDIAKICKQQATISQLENLLNSQDEEIKELETKRKLLVQKKNRYFRLYNTTVAEVKARVDTLNKVCEYYLTEVQFKADTDPNEAVKEVINEILNTEVEM